MGNMFHALVLRLRRPAGGLEESSATNGSSEKERIA